MSAPITWNMHAGTAGLSPPPAAGLSPASTWRCGLSWSPRSGRRRAPRPAHGRSRFRPRRPPTVCHHASSGTRRWFSCPCAFRPALTTATPSRAPRCDCRVFPTDPADRICAASTAAGWCSTCFAQYGVAVPRVVRDQLASVPAYGSTSSSLAISCSLPRKVGRVSCRHRHRGRSLRPRAERARFGASRQSGGGLLGRTYCRSETSGMKLRSGLRRSAGALGLVLVLRRPSLARASQARSGRALADPAAAAGDLAFCWREAEFADVEILFGVAGASTGSPHRLDAYAGLDHRLIG